MIRPIYILYGVNISNDKCIKYYIANSNPVIWANEFNQSKVYFNQYNAEFDILRDYDNYQAVKAQIDSGAISRLYVAEIIDNKEKRRVKLL